jgi:dienelactone hydrolase
VAILLLTDVLGNKFNNAQLIADQIAANGYSVIAPDLFHGDPVPINRPEGFDLMKWLKEGTHGLGHNVQTVDPVVKAAIKYMKEEMGVKRIGAVGYCFGAKYVVRELGEQSIVAGYCAHPSFVEADELKQIKGPFSISAAETDQIFPAEKRHESEVILKGTGQPYQINLFSGVEHGFAVRADLSKKHTKFAKEAAFMQAIAWFDEYLK